jgi:serine/threonine protein kinase
MGFVYRHVIEVNAGVKIPEERAWDYFIDILLGVEYLHSLNVVHRDIKPSNLLLDAEDRVKVHITLCPPVSPPAPTTIYQCLYS